MSMSEEKKKDQKAEEQKEPLKNEPSETDPEAQEQPKPAEKQSEQPDPKPAETNEPKSEPPKDTESDILDTQTDTRVTELEAENLSLKTQLEAMKLGFRSDTIEDAVTLAESIAKRDNVDVVKALQMVSKKYPDWKSDDNTKGGFKVGADSSTKRAENSPKNSTVQKRWNRFNY